MIITGNKSLQHLLIDDVGIMATVKSLRVQFRSHLHKNMVSSKSTPEQKCIDEIPLLKTK